ncbi:hypothetical protein K8I61_13465 [bacterium]|nr:hypothetical protein [bacterium]
MGKIQFAAARFFRERLERLFLESLKFVEQAVVRRLINQSGFVLEDCERNLRLDKIRQGSDRRIFGVAAAFQIHFQAMRDGMTVLAIKQHSKPEPMMKFSLVCSFHVSTSRGI